VSQTKPSQMLLGAIPGMVAWRNRPIRYLILCGVLLVTAIVVGTATMVVNSRSRALADSERELKNTALILSEQIDRSFQAIELVQRSLTEKIQSLGIASSEDYARQMSGQDVHLTLKASISGLAHVGAVTLIDADGKLLNSSRDWPIPAANVADRDYFKALKTDAQQTSFISLPVRNRITDEWTLFLASKIKAANGEFLGVILGAIELSYFEKLFGSIVLKDDSLITLYRGDGVLLARYPRIESGIGTLSISAINALGDNNSGTARFISRIEGKDRLLAAHRLPNYPLFVSVSLDTETALAIWQKQTNTLLGAGGLAAFTIALMIVLIVRQLSQALKLSSQKSALDKQQLDIAINNMPQGLLLFDSSERIVVCNRRYIEMYGLSPDVVKPGCTFRDLLSHRKATGSYIGDADEYYSTLKGKLAQREPYELIAEVPDGRLMRIANQPLSNGGWVATHEDITERERLLRAQNVADMSLREQKRQLDDALNTMMQGLCMFDANGRIVLFNQRYVDMMGHSADDLAGLSLLDLFERRKAAGRFSGDPKLFYAHVLADVRAGKSTPIITESFDGRTLRIVNQPTANGGWVATIEDITEQRKVEQERDRGQEFLNQIINNVPTTIIVKDARDLRYVLINQAGVDYFGVSREQIIGKTAHEVFPQAAADMIADRDRKLLQSDGYLFFDVYPLDLHGKRSRFVTAKRLIIRDGKGEPQYLLAVIEDVTESKLASERIAHLAHYDSLTDLPNRALFREQLEQSLKWVHRGERIAVLFLDIDEFKTVNDTLGHLVGDELLKAMASRLRTCLRDTDIVARLGGDEFAIIQTAIVGPGDVINLVMRIQEALKEPWEAGGHQLVADTSIGIALSPDDGTDPDQLLKNADLAMYGAKAQGRGNYRFFELAMDARAKARRALETDLRQAIICAEFELYYQPLVNLRDSKIVGCEALLRWRHHQRGMISPAEFIPIAEETGLITPLGEWVLRTACAEATTWPDDIRIAVNVSPVQFRSGGLVQLVTNVLAASRLPARRLELEITEAVLIHDDEAALAMLHQLRELGVRIALDDFGTGYSSLSYLHRFPFDKIKIDHSFIKDVANSAGSRSIVQAVVGIAKARDITTTAEGVETEQQLKMLRTLGCTEMQGYLYSPPLTAAKITELLVARRKIVPLVA